MRPQEFDLIRLLRPLPEHGLPAGSRGTVVMDYAKDANADLPPAYEVEFADVDGATRALVTLGEGDLEVVWRPGSGA
ncbi:hypothetical protein BRW65_29140 [Mycobacterium paraffinicum]|uniref:DUF4926 domain-containing protein n=1 Tax=Mycobacterium paraffinicum TaxID=53378 RepID=A0A1Q4H9X5_9MYCO|nr:DUF4926 domain-containing protein [Mycobacterium paraffinicum]OJZ64303.1 hypothetical protein BRW65_29140 [Mycobacterium paraffinicum]